MNSFHLKVKKINIEDGNLMMVMINDSDALAHGLNSVDKVNIFHNKKELVADVVLSPDIPSGCVGVFSDAWKKFKLKEGDIVKVSYADADPKAIESIRKKLLGKKLNEEETALIISEIAKGKLSDVQTAYYVASSFFYKPSNEELFFTAKAMAETGETFKFDSEIVADKHCMGGVSGNETTMIVVPIIASLGITIPKSFSKAITSPAATGECVNVLMDMEFDQKEIYKLVKKNNSCLIWGGGLNLAPADDKIIRVNYPIAMEPHSKAVISIMAKKAAMGITHCLIDLPVGKTAKIHSMKDALELKKQFEYVGKKFGMKMCVEITEAKQPIGAGVGPRLQVREVLRVLQQHPDRPIDLEEKAIYLASRIIEITGYAKKTDSVRIATEQLKLGVAWRKMRDIIKSQNGDAIDCEKVDLGDISYDVKSDIDGVVKEIDMKVLNGIARTLGCPIEETAGIYLHKKLHDFVEKGDILFTMYTRNENRLEDAINDLKNKKFYEISN